MQGTDTKLLLAVTIGEPAGIGPEIILKAWAASARSAIPPFFVLGDADFLATLAERLSLDIPVRPASVETAPAIFNEALPVIGLSAPLSARPGHPEAADAPLIAEAIRRAVSLASRKQAAGIVTAPIHKKALYSAGFAYPGHTEFLAALAGEHSGRDTRSVMMLAGPELRAVPVTVHIPLSAVPAALRREAIVETGQIVARDLAGRFAIAAPRLAISGLNPHAGEAGAMGTEEIDIIGPAVETLRAEGVNAFGPLPGDTLFHPAARATYDAVLCMYHDQALIPAKTLAFDDTVNVTLGLPFIRTSPDHGTAFDIAGTGKANPASMIAALRLAGEMADHERRSAVVA